MMSRRLIGWKSLIWTVERKRTARYPKLGARGLGGSERAARWGMALGSYVGASNEETLLIPVIETKEASANIAGILSVPGLEAIFFLAGRPFAKLW
jgi:2-keto-3-deoxy-L-rhamnonate aldolase RhmA